MSFPVQIAYRGLDRSEALDRVIAEEAAKLSKFFDGIVSCRVLIERRNPSHHTGAAFRVHLNVAIPGTDVAIMTEPRVSASAVPIDAAATARQAFRRARRRLREYAQRKSAKPRLLD